MIKNNYLKLTIESISREVELGSSLSNALNTHKEVFPAIFLRLAVIGEETGSLDKSLADVANHLQRMEDLASSIKKAMLYPIFAIIATFGALIFWLVFVLPQIMELFNNMGMSLPATTRLLFWMSNFCQTYWYLLLLAPFIIVLSIKLTRRHEKGRYYLDLLLIKLPIMKQIFYNKLLAIFTEQLKILTVAGITVDKSFSIVSEVIGNEVFKKAIDNVREEVTGGSMISEAIAKQEVFPPLVMRMVDVGEKTGTLDERYSFLSAHYLQKLEDTSQKIGTLIEPIVIGFIGLMFAFIIMSLMLPIYDLVSGME